MYHVDDTICAIATAPSGAARGILRLSGPRAVDILASCWDGPVDGLRLQRVAKVLSGQLRLDDCTIESLECELYLWPNRHSYTRQPAAEIHAPGSPPLLTAALRTLCRAGARMALPGEFTLRAFLAGRIDLTQAEAVLSVIDARGQRSLETALQQLAGGLATPVHDLRESLADLSARLEAGLDFVEDDIEFILRAQIGEELARAQAIVAQLRQQLTGRLRQDAAVRVVFVGWPNVGKSRLFNALAGDSQALVSNVAGTTRDYLTAAIDLDGTPCELVDTAGVESPHDTASIAAKAQHLAADAQRAAEVRLLCLDASRPANSLERAKLSQADPAETIIVLTKCDLAAGDVPLAGIRTSAATGAGLDDLRSAIRRAVQQRLDVGTPNLTWQRSAESILGADESLRLASQLNANGNGEELIAAEVRMALAELGKVAGAIYTDDILDRIFSRFCIGK